MSYPPPGPPPGPQQPPYGQQPYPQPQYGQPPYGPPPGQPTYGQPYPQQPYGQQPPWDPRAQAHPHPEPRSYPLMLRTWTYAWWKPIVGMILGLFTFLVIQFALILILVVDVVVRGGSEPFADRLTEASSLDEVTPASMLYLNLGLASLVLVTWFVVRVVHGLRPRWLASVQPGIRWKFLGACFGLSLVALVVSVLVSLLLPEDSSGLGGEPNKLTGTLIATGIVILLTTPLQALGEEYAFRGYLMQAFGSLTGSRIAALLVTSVLFALAHGVQNFPLFFDRFAFGLMAGLTVILIGGLEAGIALHIFNNLLAFGIAIFFGDLQGALTVSEVSWWQLPVTIAQNGVYLLLVLYVARRMGLRNTTAPPVEQAAA